MQSEQHPFAEILLASHYTTHSYGTHRPNLAYRIGGAREDRTPDLLLAKQALSQLSYGPILTWWVWLELNQRPHPYQGCALTN